MQIGFALCHGWALGKQSLHPLRSLLEHHYSSSEVVTFDLGFFGHEECPPLSPNRRWIAIGHSYGFCYLMQQPVQWEAAIAINGFLHFCRHGGKRMGTPVHIVDAMLAALKNDQRAVLEAFYERCGEWRTVPETLDTSLLQEHLRRLRDVDLGAPACKTLALFTKDDAIVSPQLVQASFPASTFLTRCFPGNHMTLMHDPTPALPLITQFIEDLHD